MESEKNIQMSKCAYCLEDIPKDQKFCNQEHRWLYFCATGYWDEADDDLPGIR